MAPDQTAIEEVNAFRGRAVERLRSMATELEGMHKEAQNLIPRVSGNEYHDWRNAEHSLSHARWYCINVIEAFLNQGK